jgi:hypothetical protein
MLKRGIYPHTPVLACSISFDLHKNYSLMQTNIPVTKQRLQHVRKIVSRLKRELLQTRKVFNQQQPLTEYPLIRIRRARKILKVSASALQRMRNKRKIPFTRMGGLLLYDYDDIRKMLHKGKTIKTQTL